MGFSKKAIFVLLGVLLLGSGLVMAIRGATVSDQTDLTRWTAVGTAGNDTTEGGNITSLNLDVNGLTDRWAGYFGNVTGTLYLTDNASGTTTYLYKWPSGNATGGEVCVSTNNTYNFATATGLTNAGNIDSAWGFSGGADLATATYNDGTCTAFKFDEQGVTISNAVKADGDSGSSSFYSCAINNTAVAYKGDLAFCTSINPSGTNYKGESADFELIVPTAEGDTATETYYFYAEIN